MKPADFLKWTIMFAMFLNAVLWLLTSYVGRVEQGAFNCGLMYAKIKRANINPACDYTIKTVLENEPWAAEYAAK